MRNTHSAAPMAMPMHAADTPYSIKVVEKCEPPSEVHESIRKLLLKDSKER